MTLNGQTLRTLRYVVATLIVSLALAGLAPHPAAASYQLERVTSSGSVTGGKTMTIRVYLNRPAFGGGTLVWLTSDSALIPVPSNVIVPPGEDNYAIRITTKPTTVTKAVKITARNGTATLSTVTVVKEPYLSSLSVQTVIRAGGQGKITVRISGIAPSGGIVVSLNSNRPSILQAPATVTIPAGAAGKSIVVNASMVSSEVAVNVSAYYDGIKITKPTVVRNMT
jgi:hypothetical protein